MDLSRSIWQHRSQRVLETVGANQALHLPSNLLPLTTFHVMIRMMAHRFRGSCPTVVVVVVIHLRRHRPARRHAIDPRTDMVPPISVSADPSHGHHVAVSLGYMPRDGRRPREGALHKRDGLEQSKVLAGWLGLVSQSCLLLAVPPILHNIAMRLSAPIRTLSATISSAHIARTTVPALYIRAMSSAAASTTAEQLVLTERKGAVTILTLNRPKALNALSTPLFDALNKELDAAEADDGVGAVIITGGDKVFAG